MTNFAVRGMCSDACLALDASRSVDRALASAAVSPSDLPDLVGLRRILAEALDEIQGDMRVVDNLIAAAEAAK